MGGGTVRRLKIGNGRTPRPAVGWGRLIGAMMVGVVLALPVAPGAARAADLAAPPPEPPPPLAVGSGWEFTLSAYAWASGIDGRMRTLPPLPTADVHIRFEQVLKNFGGALMGAAELRNGRFLIFTDVMFARIDPDHDFRFRGFEGGAKLNSVTATALGAVGYRVFDDPRFFVDVLAGARVFYADNTLKLQYGPLPAINYGKDETWAVPAAGARLRVNFDANWFATAIGFVGAADLKSNYYWDVYGGLGYAFNERYSAFAGYRVMKVGYEQGNFIYNVVQSGPILGLNIRF
jgi:hypothetical protein